MTVEAREWRTWITGLLLVSIVALGATLRLYRMEAEAAWCDEVLSLTHIHEDGLAPFLAAVQRSNPPTVPFYFVLEYAWSRTFSDSVDSLRLLSILIGCLTIPAVYSAGRLIVGRRPALFAALVVAAHPMHIYYSQEIRMYGLGWLEAVWSIYTLVQLLTTSKTRWWVLHGLVNLALLWTHLFNSFLLAAEGLFLFYYLCRHGNWVRLAQWTAIQVACVSTLVIWSVLLANHDSITDAMAWVLPLSYDRVMEVVRQYLGWADVGYMYFKSNLALKSNNLAQSGLVWAFALSYVFLLVQLIRRKANAAPPAALTDGEAFCLLSLWAFVPMLALALVSVLVEPSFVTRYTGYCSFGFFLLIGTAIDRIRYRPAALAALLIFATFLGSQTAINASNRPLRCGWAEAARCIQSAAGDQPVYSNDPTGAVALSYYLGRPINNVPQHSDLDDWRRLTPFLSAQKKPGWMVFMQGYGGAREDFERYISDRRLPCTKNVIPGGMYPLMVYHIVPLQSSKPASTRVQVVEPQS